MASHYLFEATFCDPASGWEKGFNELLVQNTAATFAVRISCESMTGADLFPNDIAVVGSLDHALQRLHRAAGGKPPVPEHRNF